MDSGHVSGSGVGGVIFFLFFVVFILAMVALTLAIWCMIVKRTGHHWALGLLMLVPVANLVLLLVLAFSTWPIQRELDDCRRRMLAVQGGAGSFQQAPPAGGPGAPGGPPA